MDLILNLILLYFHMGIYFSIIFQYFCQLMGKLFKYFFSLVINSWKFALILIFKSQLLWLSDCITDRILPLYCVSLKNFSKHFITQWTLLIQIIKVLKFTICHIYMVFCGRLQLFNITQFYFLLAKHIFQHVSFF